MAKLPLVLLFIIVVIEVMLTSSSSPEIQADRDHCTVGKDDPDCGWQSESQNSESPTVMNNLNDLGEYLNRNPIQGTIKGYP